jgi:Protein of unknown function (DUF2975)
VSKLSFFNKKDLTNGIDWFIPCAMNANEISLKTNSRMNRIQKVSKCIRLFLLYGIPLIWIGFLVSIFFVSKDWATTQLNSPDAKIVVAQMNSTAGHLWTLSEAILFLFWYRTVLKLFGFFERGILFTPETVRCIQILGGIYIADFLVGFVFYFLIPKFLNDWGLGHLLAGLFIIFIGWLIDEARKIQEEQELTV